jgi:hypothetical protein
MNRSDRHLLSALERFAYFSVLLPPFYEIIRRFPFAYSLHCRVGSDVFDEFIHLCVRQTGDGVGGSVIDGDPAGGSIGKCRTGEHDVGCIAHTFIEFLGGK